LKIDIIFQVTRNLQNLYNNLYLIENTYTDVNYTIALFFIDPWQVEDFTNYKHKFKNTIIYLVDDHAPENFNIYLKNYNTKVIRFYSDYTILTATTLQEILI